MKKIFLLIIAVCTFSCKETIDFLPTNAYNEAVVWENEESVKLYINSFYRIFTEYFQYGNNPIGSDGTMSDGLTDILKYSSNSPGEGTANLIMTQDNYTSVAANPTGSIFQNFHVVKSGSNFIFTFVNREPTRRSPKADPTAYIVTVPAASITAGTPVTSLPNPQNITGIIAGGIGDGPNMELAPIPNSTDYFFNSGTISPTLVSPTLGNPIWFSTALVNGSSVGLKAFEHNRGKYLMYGVFTWSDNLANPKASKFVLLDVTKKGYRQSIVDINAEFASVPAQFTTWNGVQKVDIGLGGKAPTADYYCQTAFATTASGKLRVAVLSENNGFMVFECE